MTKTAKESGADPSSGPEAVTPGAASGPAGKQRSKNQEKGSLQVVEFLLGRERYAIDLFDVREVVEYTTITKLPNTASYMKGIIDLRGEITTIVDLKDRLHIPPGAEVQEENSRIIVLDEEITKAKTGIMVDDVLSVSTFDKGVIDYTSAADMEDEGAILGIIKKKVKDKDHERNELIIWIDIRYLLRDIGETAS